MYLSALTAIFLSGCSFQWKKQRENTWSKSGAIKLQGSCRLHPRSCLSADISGASGATRRLNRRRKAVVFSFPPYSARSQEPSLFEASRSFKQWKKVKKVIFKIDALLISKIIASTTLEDTEILTLVRCPNNFSILVQQILLSTQQAPVHAISYTKIYSASIFTKSQWNL